MRIDRLPRLPGYRDPRADCDSLYDLFSIPISFVFRLGDSVWTFVASCTAFCISPIVSGIGEDAQTTWAGDDYARPETIHMGLGFYSHFPEPDEADVVSDDDHGDTSPDISANSYPIISCLSYGAPLWLRGGCNSDESGLEDGESYVYDAPEFWDVPAHRVAVILDVSDTPECLQGDRKLMSVDAYIKKQWQDAWTGPTGSKKTGLALVTILTRSDIATQEIISGPMFESKNAEGTDIVAIATAFYRSMTNQHCKAKGEGQFECGGHAVMRKYRTGKSSGKHHFIGCSNWSDGDSLSHRFTKIPPQVRESIFQSLVRGEEITEEDTEVVEGYCSAIIHPSHLPRNKQCARIHYRDNKSVVGHLEAHTCPAELLILIPVDQALLPMSGQPAVLAREARSIHAGLKTLLTRDDWANYHEAYFQRKKYVPSLISLPSNNIAIYLSVSAVAPCTSSFSLPHRNRATQGCTSGCRPLSPPSLSNTSSGWPSARICSTHNSTKTTVQGVYAIVDSRSARLALSLRFFSLPLHPVFTRTSWLFHQ
ncbi:hypothetical protein DFH07DRAFT_1017031 [Mycena maculata]|uniref:Uncharacterized protein n=1 Tax=Mycena maculata TaxID=230809 RepID=A0AAD7JG03_9AGAR|nr:hypothetical protein DFH07DRAFT_1017031 [Mycena maculata]